MSEPRTDRSEYRWNLAAAIILSWATLVSAWCGFQASVWGSTYSTESRAANTARLQALKATDIANQQTTTDVLLFATWLEAEVTGNTRMAAEVEERFPDRLDSAFTAWRAQPAEEGHLPDGSPLDRPEYVLAAQADVDAAHERADAALQAADAAGAYNTRYVASTVLYASVLFLVGIASKLSQVRMAHAVVGLAGLTLLIAMALQFSLPVSLG